MADYYINKTAAQIDALLTKIDGVEANAEVNQNAFSNIKINSYNIEAGGKTSTVELIAGDNIAIVPNALAGTITISFSGMSAVQADWSQQDSEAYDYIKNKPNIPAALSDLSDDSTHRIVSDTEKSTWNAKSDFSGSYNDLTDKPTIPTVNDATLTIQKNGTAVGTFTANQSVNEAVNIIVPVVASDIGALPNTTKYGSSLTLSIDSSTYVVTASLKDQNGDALGSSQTIDLPLETMVVSGSYDAQTKKIVLTLKNGTTVEFSVADLVSGLQTEITSQNKLSADLVDDTTSTHKFVTSADKTAWDAKSDFSGSYNDLTNKPTLGTAAVKDIPSSGDASSEQVVMGNDTRLSDARTPTSHTHTKSEITDFPTLAAVATSGSYNDLSNKPTIPAAQVNSNWNASSGVAKILNKPTLGAAASRGVDTTPASGSTNLITSGGVYAVVGDINTVLESVL